MKKLKIILITILFSSCQLIRVLSVEEQNNESQEEIDAFLKNKYEYDYSINFIDSLSFKFTDFKHNIIQDTSRKTPALQLRIYHRNGYLFSGYTQCVGDFRKKRFLGNNYPVIPNENCHINYTLKLKDEFELWDIDSGKLKEIKSDVNNSEYIFVLYWNCWTSYFSKRLLHEISRYKKKYSDKDILIIIVNNSIDVK